MSIFIYNTKTGKKDPFVPLIDNEVSFYVCGPTVYNYVHIGNARPAIIFDTFNRLLQLHYDKVTYARNITDMYDVLYHHSTGDLDADRKVFENVTVKAITLSTNVGAAEQIDELLIDAITPSTGSSRRTSRSAMSFGSFT